jgi:elongator complex protein 1
MLASFALSRGSSLPSLLHTEKPFFSFGKTLSSVKGSHRKLHAMRNLVLQGEIRRKLASSNDEEDAPSPDAAANDIVDLCHVWAGDGTAAVVLTRAGTLARTDRDGFVLWKVNLNGICTEPAKEWFQVTYVEPNLVCLSHSGTIATVNTETGDSELVGEFENGVDAAAWSRDREVLVLVTTAEADDDPTQQKSVLLSMNTQFEVLAEVEIEKHVSRNASKDAKVSIYWSGTTCAVSGVDAADNMRKIRWYKKENLELHAIGRTEDGSGKLAPNMLPTDIAWAGSGCSNLLAAVQQKGRTLQVAFFEPNGLRHREFPLRCDAAADIISLCWNEESDLLAVLLQEGNDSKVQLWHRSNYHWYLKREFLFTDRRVSRIKFHEEDSYRLDVLFGTEWIEYTVRWEASLLLQTSASTTAWSVDGCSLNWTDFENAFVPPPMYASTLTLPAPVSEIAASTLTSNNTFGVVSLSTGQLAVPKRESNVSGKDPHVPSAKADVATWTNLAGLDPTSFRSLVVVQLRDTYLCLVAIAPSPRHGIQVDALVEIRLSATGEAEVTATFALESRALAVSPWSDGVEGALVQLEDGSLLRYKPAVDDQGTLMPSAADRLLEPCPKIAAIKNTAVFGAGEHSHHPHLIVGMSTRGRLYCHDLLLADSVSSFQLSTEQQFLCYATAGSRGVLRFLPISDLVNFDPLQGSDENQMLQGYEPRNVERGTRLVAVLSQKPAAVLQMPRGNLEIVYPRSLVLRNTMMNIDSRQYKDAFEMMRRHKVDLNLIVDMDPWYFLEESGVVELVEQVQNIDHLNLFVSCLQNWDSTEQRYPIPEWLPRKSEACEDRDGFSFQTKVNQVCRKLRSVMVEAEEEKKTKGGRTVGEGHFLLPILSTFAKEEPPQLESALALIKSDVLRKHPSTSKKPPLFSDAAQHAIHYLAFLAEYELLFETALGVYDYDMARAVARNSQMDPKVYLPLLKRFRELPFYYGRFEVDMRLKRYESALRNLWMSGSSGEVVESTAPIPAADDGNAKKKGNRFSDCMALIEEYKLYELGLELCKEDTQRRQIMVSLGDYLLETKEASAALSVYLAAEPRDKDRCLRAARESRDWAILFSLSEEISVEKQHFVAREIADELAASAAGTFHRRETLMDASRVLLDYGADVAGAVNMLIRAEAWTEAQRIGCLHSRGDLLQKVVDAAVSFAQSAIMDLDERGEAFLKASHRYIEVLKIRKEAIASGEGGAGELIEHDDVGSLFSASSNASNLSMRSTASTGSVSSSISSVISVKSASSFSVTGGNESSRHKSKFNQLGQKRKKKKKKKSKGKSSKIRPGSEEELQGLVQTLKVSCTDETYCKNLGETITFLVRNGQQIVARELFDAYIALSTLIRKTQSDRLEAARLEALQMAKQARIDGNAGYEPIVHSVNKDVDSLVCASLDDKLHRLFSFLPKEEKGFN